MPGDSSALADAIRKLAEDKEKAHEMGLRGRAYMEEHFSRVAIGEKLLTLLDEMTN